ncbi:endonuclease/exonuclease/phosphatase family protein [Aureimonas pseudogalii]|uniref:Endonuclease/exonuclease/phosphatase family metal-dependent hydrolase n=1 Tax=Aureimonas pseudogalii TaxID=1744844 RepID=A0A7W6EBW1_9HYPH|nr:endonuclease/exonuclease/phosphatase family protein [Aureimonas pseudogalii]MBB3998004.1 endonuclease/exonuclease/phosphatase family metal-dependent hydrolase [Aureimonas pseudogalii]
MSPADDGPAIRLATWNIHGFKGEGRRPDPDRTLDLIDGFGADIVALQEVDGRSHLGRLPGAFERLARRWPQGIVEARLFGSGEKAYGHALWSRWPILGAEVRLLPGPGLEPRALIDATVDTPIGPLRVLAAHFGLRPAARRAQADFLLSLPRGGGATVALGDFNEWRSDGGVHRRLAQDFPVSLRSLTWPVRRPLVAFDRIYASAGLSLTAVAPPVGARAASDHWPVIADLRRTSN